MNIYNFLRSPDIAAHCENISHVFNPLEMAVIIDLSEQPIKEKNMAWSEIVNEYPDMPIHESLNFEAKASLHDFLREQIAWNEERLAEIYEPNHDCVYRPVVYSCCEIYDENMGYYSSAEKAWKAIRDIYSDWATVSITHARIYKYFVDSDCHEESVWLNSDGEAYLYYGWHEQQSKLRPDDLQMIFIHIPVPFEKGDIVAFCDGKPRVLWYIPHWSQGLKYIKYNYEDFLSGVACCDGSDFSANTYYFNGSHLANCGDPYNLHDLRFFKGKLKGQDQFLKYLSYYIKSGHDDFIWLTNVLNTFKAKTEFEKLHSQGWLFLES